MRAVIQRVTRAEVSVDGEVVGRVPPECGGLLVLVGVADGDDSADAEWMARKIAHLRVMPDAEGRMNRSVVECGGALLLVSQFTLLGDARKGRRPSFDRAALPAVAVPLLETVRLHLLSEGIPVETGRFGAHMEVGLVNDGPVTLVLDSAERSR